jgi:Mce-associated membrane protein
MGTGRPHDTAVLRVVIACTVAAMLAVGCTSEHRDKHALPPPPANLAFIDVEATHAVTEQIAPAVARFFSYDYRRFDAHLSETMADTTPRYWTELEPSLRIVREVAPGKQVVANAEVVATSVRVLEPSRAELLLFVNRRTTQASAAPQLEASSVVVKAARTGPHWKIDGMTLS